MATIRKYAFSECTKLANITIPDTVTTIEEGAFSYCETMSSIVIPSAVKIIERRVFIECYNLTSVIIPNGVTHIKEYAFEFCKSLTSIVIPSSVKKIEAFGNTLKSITFDGKIPPSVSTLIFSTIENIYVPESVVHIYKNAEGFSQYADKIKPKQ